MSFINKLQQLDADEFELVNQNRHLQQPMYEELLKRSPECLLESIRIERMHLRQARERCLQAGNFLLNIYFNNKEALLTLEQYRAFVRPYKAFTVEFVINPAMLTQSNLPQQRLIEVLGANVGEKVFDATGGAFISAFVEAEDISAGSRLRCYFVGAEPEESGQDILMWQQS